MLTDLRYIAGQLRRAKRHLANKRAAGVADSIAKAMMALVPLLEAEEAREAEHKEHFGSEWTVEEILAREG